MIQFNLLPDVKIQFIRARRAKRVVMVVSALAVVISVGLLAITISATMLQNRHIGDLNKDIASYEKDLNSTSDLAKILTIQNQANSLPALYDSRPITSRLFGYIQATTPANVSIASVKVGFEENTLDITGNATNLELINRYVDTLKFTTYTLKDSEEKTAPFTDIVLTSFSRDDKTASYAVKLVFDPEIFNVTKEVTFNVPKTITTRSETQLPGSGVFDTKETN